MRAFPPGLACDCTKVVKYVISLFPCGAVAPPFVERADGSAVLNFNFESRTPCFRTSCELKLSTPFSLRVPHVICYV